MFWFQAWRENHPQLQPSSEVQAEPQLNTSSTWRGSGRLVKAICLNYYSRLILQSGLVTSPLRWMILLCTGSSLRDMAVLDVLRLFWMSLGLARVMGLSGLGLRLSSSTPWGVWLGRWGWEASPSRCPWLTRRTGLRAERVRFCLIWVILYLSWHVLGGGVSPPSATWGGVSAWPAQTSGGASGWPGQASGAQPGG